jgi:hypothetical protein
MILKVLTLSLCTALCACQSLEMPKGHSAGYQSARFVEPRKNPFAQNPTALEDSKEVNQMVKNAIASDFKRHGMPIVEGSADLIIAHMLLRQGNISTTRNQEYFGYGRDANAIMEEAHKRGVLQSSRPDAFDDGAVVIDILDAGTNKLVYRGFAKGAVIPGISAGARQARIDSAVAQALADFFK